MFTTKKPLTIKKTKDEDIEKVKTLFETSIHVDMHFSGKSTNEPLFSDSFANCLGVVVHDAKNQRGYLMHIFPALAGGTNPYTLFYFVDQQIEKALDDFSDSDDIQLILFKGASYTPLGLSKLKTTYAEYAEKRFEGRIEKVIDLMDGNKNGISFESKLLYDPGAGTVYIIDYHHDLHFDSNRLTNKSSDSLETWSFDHVHELALSDHHVQSDLDTMKEIFGEKTPAFEKKHTTHTPLISPSDETHEIDYGKMSLEEFLSFGEGEESSDDDENEIGKDNVHYSSDDNEYSTSFFSSKKKKKNESSSDEEFDLFKGLTKKKD